jgi:C_GCAxxG_C_C family probable redox protein
VLGGFAERHGLTMDQAARIGCAFGGGIARTGQMCGAVSGALMVIGLSHGSTSGVDAVRRDHTYAVTKEFLAAFTARHGSITCQELLGVNIGTPDGRKTAMDNGLFKTHCPAFVRDAAALTATLV